MLLKVANHTTIRLDKSILASYHQFTLFTIIAESSFIKFAVKYIISNNYINIYIYM